MPTLEQRILHLKSLGQTYKQIVETIGCSKGTVSYYLGVGQKAKTRHRTQKLRRKAHPFAAKIIKFRERCQSGQRRTLNLSNSDRKILTDKILTFHRDRKTKMYNPVTFTVEDVINKVGQNPVCYLTGKTIEIDKPRTYQFDHVVPVARGGDNSLENLAIATKEANIAKNNMTNDEFVNLCKAVLEHHGYSVTKEILARIEL